MNFDHLSIIITTFLLVVIGNVAIWIYSREKCKGNIYMHTRRAHFNLCAVAAFLVIGINVMVGHLSKVSEMNHNCVTADWKEYLLVGAAMVFCVFAAIKGIWKTTKWVLIVVSACAVIYGLYAGIYAILH